MIQKPRATLKADWLTRAFSRAGVLTKTEAEAAIRAGRVTICGRRVREPLAVLRPGDRVCLDGRRISLSAKTMVIAFHKPMDSVVAPNDDQGKATVFHLLARALPPELARYEWHAIGRLDRDTTGLLLFTNNEKLISHVTSPANHLPKRYLAQVYGKVDDQKLDILRHGMLLDDGRTLPAQARSRGPNEIELTLTEGRFHQVKRMLGAIGLPVKRLHREAVGGINIDIAEGAWRLLTEEEITDGLKFVAQPDESNSHNGDNR